MAKRSDPSQYDLFFEPVYPLRQPEPRVDAERLNSELARALKRAVDASGRSRFEVAQRMAEALGQDDFSKAMIDAYTSESKGTHTITIARFIAFILATEQVWLMDFLAKKVGGLCLFGEEPHLAEQARLDQEVKALQAKKKQLMARPVKIERRVR